MQSEGTYYEEASYHSANCVCSVDSTNDVRTRMVEVGDPMLRVLEGIEYRRIIAVQDHAAGSYQGYVPVVHSRLGDHLDGNPLGLPLRTMVRILIDFEVIDKG
jgi:hypothetical protein